MFFMLFCISVHEQWQLAAYHEAYQNAPSNKLKRHRNKGFVVCHLEEYHARSPLGRTHKQEHEFSLQENIQEIAQHCHGNTFLKWPEPAI